MSDIGSLRAAGQAERPGLCADAANGVARRGTTGNMMELGVFESFKVKQQVLLSATEAAEMILRVDDIIKAAPRQRQ